MYYYYVKRRNESTKLSLEHVSKVISHGRLLNTRFSRDRLRKVPTLYTRFVF